jgi:hypothetical protein
MAYDRVICPRGARPGDVVIVVLLPLPAGGLGGAASGVGFGDRGMYCWRPPVGPANVVAMSRRRFARGHGITGLGLSRYLPSAPTLAATEEEQEEEEEDQERELEQEEEETLLVTDAFWKIMWPCMCSDGWRYEHNLDYSFGVLKFFPPPPAPPPPCRLSTGRVEGDGD